MNLLHEVLHEVFEKVLYSVYYQSRDEKQNAPTYYMLKTLKIILINILVFFILIIFFEITFGYILNKKNNLDCHYLLCKRIFRYETNLHKNISNYQIIYQRDNFGFRNRHKDFNNIDILVIGGSTTDERYLKDQHTWTNQLQTMLSNYYNLDINVVNSGIDGQSTFGHLWNFENWYSKIKNFSPNYIFFYIGINEGLYLPDLYGSKNQEINFDNKQDISNFSISNKIKFFIKKNNSIIYKIYTAVNDFFKNDLYVVGHSNKRIKNNYEVPNKKFEIDEEAKKLFLNNLNSLYKHSKEIGSIPVFITQKTLRGKKINNQIFSINEYDFFSYEKNISDIIINFCESTKLYCINLNKNFNLKTNYTYDLVHFSPQGSKELSKFLFNNLKDKILIKK